MDEDTVESPSSETETRQRQNKPGDSETLREPDVDDAAVRTAPGTGGPDDAGDVDVDDIEYHPKGRPDEGPAG